MAEGSLKDKTVEGVAWSGIDNIAQYVVTFIVGIVLARLLSPDDYGLIGIVTIFTAICTTLINAGFTTALIRKKNATEDDYNTVFLVNLGMSLLLYVFIYFGAPFIADFFHRDELVLLTRVSSCGMIIGALALVQQTRLTKRIDFKSQTKITVVASLSSGVIGMVMALLDFGVWALVAQYLSSQTIRTVMLWFVNKWVPNYRFSKSSFHELFGFGWKILASNVLDTIWKELNQVVVGKYYNPATLGQYTRATQFSNLFSSNLTNIIQRVTFPTLSNIQDDNTRMLSAYRRIIKVTMFITAICMFFLGAISEPLLYCLIGAKWHEAATYLPLICISASTYPLHALNLNMLEVQGRSDLFLGIEAVKKIIALGPLFIGATIGIVPMLYANIAASIIAYFLNSYYSGKLIGYSSWMQIKDIAPSFIIATLIAVPVYFLKFMPFSNWIILPVQIVAGVMFFLMITKLTNSEEYKEIITICEPFIKRKK